MNATLVLLLGYRSIPLHNESFYQGYQYGRLEMEGESAELTDAQVAACLATILHDDAHNEAYNAGRVIGWVHAFLEGDSRPLVPSFLSLSQSLNGAGKEPRR